MVRLSKTPDKGAFEMEPFDTVLGIEPDWYDACWLTARRPPETRPVTGALGWVTGMALLLGGGSLLTAPGTFQKDREIHPRYHAEMMLVS